MDEGRIARRVDQFAHKFLAEVAIGRVWHQPTDSALADAFRNCGKPIKPEMYPAVRERVREIRAERGELS